MNRRHKKCLVCGIAYLGHFNAKFCGEECLKTFKRGYEKAYRAAHRTQPEEETFDPFPKGIDRGGFGNWLSGFSDGESTFVLRSGTDEGRGKELRYAFFRIHLRDDDIEVLKLIRSYWRCGVMSRSTNIRSQVANAKPIAGFTVQRVGDLIHTVIPHFDLHPLLSKKRRDFMVWRRGVALLAEVQARPPVGRLIKGGICPRWTNEDRRAFDRLSEELSEQRQYKNA